MRSRLRSHHHHLVAYAALFFALGGSAIAAKPLITGADVKDDSLTGADIVESSLGEVPAAANALTLDGLRAGGFARFGGIVKADGEVLQGTGGFTVERLAAGVYQLGFPSGTFEGCHRPIVTATPATGRSTLVAAGFGADNCSDDGSASIIVFIQRVDADGLATNVDQPFAFIAM